MSEEGRLKWIGFMLISLPLQIRVISMVDHPFTQICVLPCIVPIISFQVLISTPPIILLYFTIDIPRDHSLLLLQQRCKLTTFTDLISIHSQDGCDFLMVFISLIPDLLDSLGWSPIEALLCKLLISLGALHLSNGIPVCIVDDVIGGRAHCFERLDLNHSIVLLWWLE